MRPLKDVEVFNLLKDAKPSALKALGRVIATTKTGKGVVTMEDLDDQIRSIKRRFNFSLKNRVISDLEKGATLPLMLDPEDLGEIPAFLPAWIGMKGAKLTAYVSLTRYARKTESGLDVDMRALFGLLQYGTIIRLTMENRTALSSNVSVLKKASMIYSRMMVKIIDARYGISMDPIAHDQLLYLFAKWFLLGMMQKSPGETVDTIALKSAVNGTTAAGIKIVDQDFSEETYETLSKFVKAIAARFSKLKKFETRTLIAEFTLAYGSSTVLAIESPAYFLATIFSAAVNAGLSGNEARIEMQLGREGYDLYSEFARTVK